MKREGKREQESEEAENGGGGGGREGSSLGKLLLALASPGKEGCGCASQSALHYFVPVPKAR